MEKDAIKFMLFFKDKTFRCNEISQWKFRNSMLPGIRHILSWWFAIKFAWRIKELDPWEQHVAKTNLERTSRKTIWVCSLLRLYGYYMAEDEYRNPEEFEIIKKEVLECEYWKDVPVLKDFKIWIENSTSEERNGDKVMAIL